MRQNKSQTPPVSIDFLIVLVMIGIVVLTNWPNCKAYYFIGSFIILAAIITRNIIRNWRAEKNLTEPGSQSKEEK